MKFNFWVHLLTAIMAHTLSISRSRYLLVEISDVKELKTIEGKRKQNFIIVSINFKLNDNGLIVNNKAFSFFNHCFRENMKWFKMKATVNHL